MERLARQYTDIIPNCDYNHDHYAAELRRFISSGTGVIFYLEDDDGQIVGGIGGIKYPCLLTGKLTAVELFWYVDKERRSGTGGVRLFDAFEEWAKAHGCAKVAMVYLPCSMPERLYAFYERRGYRLAEMHFEKEIKP